VARAPWRIKLKTKNGRWTGELVVNGGALGGVGANTQFVTFYVLPSGTFYGTIDLIPGDGACWYLISGSLVKGGTQITSSWLTSYAAPIPQPTECGFKDAIGGSKATRAGNILHWILSTPLLSANYTLSLSSSSIATTAEGYRSYCPRVLSHLTTHTSGVCRPGNTQ
jgi:hypothetical protein